MDDQRYLDCLDNDYRQLRTVVADALGAPVPTCPGWTGADLAAHVAEVYLHKAEVMRLGDWPAPWPPDLGTDPLAALDAAYRELTAEFAARTPDEPSLTWYQPVQTVGFWLRRMTQETVIHRVDAELTAERPPTAIPADLAEDGIDEVLERFLAYSAVEYPQEIGAHLTGSAGGTVRIEVPTASWLVRIGSDTVTVERGPADSRTDKEADKEAAVLRGGTDPVLRWLWRRVGDEAVTLDGNRAVLDTLRQLMAATTV